MADRYRTGNAGVASAGGGHAFRPALRFPTDPLRPTELPTRTSQITQPQHPQPKATRKPWELDVERLPDSDRPSRGKKVVVVLGDPPTASLDPLVSSIYLRGSLLIIITSADANLGITPSTLLPDVRILRLKHTTASGPETLSAGRLVSSLEWAHNVAEDWRSDQNPLPFAVALEDSLSGGSAKSSSRTVKFKPKPKALPTSSRPNLTLDDAVNEPSFSALWPPRFNNSSNSSDTGSPRSSMYMMNGGSVQSHTEGMSTASVPGTATAARHQRLRSSVSTTAFTNISITPSVEAAGKGANKSRISIFSIGGSSKDKSRRKSTSSNIRAGAQQRSFDVIINFLPGSPAVASAGFGIGVGYGPGTVSSLNAQAAQNKNLLRQTILVTTACQRFLCPVVPVARPGSSGHGSSSWLHRLATAEDQNRSDQWDTTPKRTPHRQSTTRRLSTAFASVFSSKNLLPTPPTSASSSGSGSGTSSPPHNMRLKSSGLGSGSAHGHGSATSALGHGSDNGSSVHHHLTHGASNLAKIVHVLPFSHIVPPHLVNSPMHLANARLIRSLEAFLLSWSYGGKNREGEQVAGRLDDRSMMVAGGSGQGLGSDKSSSLSSLFAPPPQASAVTSASSSSLPSLTSTPAHLLGAKARSSSRGVIRPFLLDLSGLGDIFKLGGVNEEVQQWSVGELIICGALDNEYALSSSREPSSGDLLAVPSASRPQSAQSSSSHDGPKPRPTSGGQWESTRGMAGIGARGTSPQANGQDETWANRRAWLGGVGDIALFPSLHSDRDRTISTSASSSAPSSPSRGRPVSTSLLSPSSSTASSTLAKQAHLRSSSFRPDAAPSSWGASVSSQSSGQRPSLNLATGGRWGAGPSSASGSSHVTPSPVDSQEPIPVPHENKSKGRAPIVVSPQEMTSSDNHNTSRNRDPSPPSFSARLVTASAAPTSAPTPVPAPAAQYFKSQATSPLQHSQTYESGMNSVETVHAMMNDMVAAPELPPRPARSARPTRTTSASTPGNSTPTNDNGYAKGFINLDDSPPRASAIRALTLPSSSQAPQMNTHSKPSRGSLEDRTSTSSYAHRLAATASENTEQPARKKSSKHHKSSRSRENEVPAPIPAPYVAIVSPPSPPLPAKDSYGERSPSKLKSKSKQPASRPAPVPFAAPQSRKEGVPVNMEKRLPTPPHSFSSSSTSTSEVSRDRDVPDFRDDPRWIGGGGTDSSVSSPVPSTSAVHDMMRGTMPSEDSETKEKKRWWAKKSTKSLKAR